MAEKEKNKLMNEKKTQRRKKQINKNVQRKSEVLV